MVVAMIHNGVVVVRRFVNDVSVDDHLTRVGMVHVFGRQQQQRHGRGDRTEGDDDSDRARFQHQPSVYGADRPKCQHTPQDSAGSGRARPGCLRHAYVTNAALMTAGFVFPGYQLAGFAIGG